MSLRPDLASPAPDSMLLSIEVEEPVMEWRDEGILLGVRRHGESSAIVTALTANHGRHAGLVRGGATRKQAANLQPGAQLSLDWRARLEGHLGTFSVDLVKSRAGPILADRGALSGLNAVASLLSAFLPEREPVPDLYQQTLDLVDALGVDPRWPVAYARWEIGLLTALGFGMDLGECAATGQKGELYYVSPRTGRAVCREAGAPYADRLLTLPQFLIGRSQATAGDVREALRLSEHFMRAWVCPAFEVAELPAARGRLAKEIDGYDMPLPPIVPPEEDDDPAAWWYNRSGDGLQ